MVYVAVCERGIERIYYNIPKRDGTFTKDGEGCWTINPCSTSMELPKGTIEKIIGRKITWADEPVEVKGEIE